MTVRLKPKELPKVPVEAYCITPDEFAGKTLEELRNLTLWVGKRRRRLGDLFEVYGEAGDSAEDTEIVVEGDVPTVKYIGYEMTAGRIVIQGRSGAHTGARMSGGEIVVEGDVGEWSGAEMSGGVLRIRGNADHFLGASYLGSPFGMTGGAIIVHGSVGGEACRGMRRGLLVVLGDAGEFLGADMVAGTIIVFGRAGRGLGAHMGNKGAVIIVHGGVEEMPPTFVYDATYSPTFIRLLMRELHRTYGVEEASRYMDAVYDRYHGDLAEGGGGEIFLLSDRKRLTNT